MTKNSSRPFCTVEYGEASYRLVYDVPVSPRVHKVLHCGSELTFVARKRTSLTFTFRDPSTNDIRLHREVTLKGDVLENGEGFVVWDRQAAWANKLTRFYFLNHQAEMLSEFVSEGIATPTPAPSGWVIKSTTGRISVHDTSGSIVLTIDGSQLPGFNMKAGEAGWARVEVAGSLDTVYVAMQSHLYAFSYSGEFMWHAEIPSSGGDPSRAALTRIQTGFSDLDESTFTEIGFADRSLIAGTSRGLLLRISEEGAVQILHDFGTSYDYIHPRFNNDGRFFGVVTRSNNKARETHFEVFVPTSGSFARARSVPGLNSGMIVSGMCGFVYVLYGKVIVLDAAGRMVFSAVFPSEVVSYGIGDQRLVFAGERIVCYAPVSY